MAMVWVQTDFSNFDGADENPLSEGGLWSQETEVGPLQIVSHTAQSVTAVNSIMYRNSPSFVADQYSEAYFDASLAYRGVCVRMTATTGYLLYISKASGTGDAGGRCCKVFKITAGPTFTLLGADFGNSLSAASAVVRLSIVGNVLTVTDGTVTVGTRTGSGNATGQPGIYASTSGYGVSAWAAGESVQGPTCYLHARRDRMSFIPISTKNFLA